MSSIPLVALTLLRLTQNQRQGPIHIAEIETLGGMARPLSKVCKLRIEVATATQAQITQVIRLSLVLTNTSRQPPDPSPEVVLRIDNHDVRAQQIASLKNPS